MNANVALYLLHKCTGSCLPSGQKKKKTMRDYCFLFIYILVKVDTKNDFLTLEQAAKSISPQFPAAVEPLIVFVNCCFPRSEWNF